MRLNKKAFTLIELIIVITTVALIAAAIFVSVNPAKRLGDTRDAIRVSDAIAIEKAIQKATIENYTIPTDMLALAEDTPYMLVTEGSATTGTCNCNTIDESIARVDLANKFKSYIGNDLPVDSEATGNDTGYYITRKSNSFYVKSCNAYGDDYVADSCTGTALTPAIGDDCITGPLGGSEQVKFAGPIPYESEYADLGAYHYMTTPTDSGAPAWKTSNTHTTEITGDDNNGWLNTLNIATADFPAGKYCADLIYGGYDDWFLPQKMNLL